VGRKEPVPCRLYGILARDEPRAILFRRGPYWRIQLICWDTSTDKFEPGQWFKGRIHERRCDLSPDGRLLVYFAFTANRSKRPDYDSGTWTAVSRPPYLTALARWLNHGTYDGGGLFLENTVLGLDNAGGYSPRWHRGPSEPTLPIKVTNLNLRFGEDNLLEAIRDKRDGWKVIQGLDITDPGAPTQPPPIPLAIERGEPIPEDYLKALSRWLEKECVRKELMTDKSRIVEKRMNSFRLRKEVRRERAELVQKYELAGSSLDLGKVEWADWDQGQRLVFARRGCIFAVRPGHGRSPKIHQLADFNSNRFQPLKAPQWALEWPKGLLEPTKRSTAPGR